jgi:hypothetical protein
MTVRDIGHESELLFVDVIGVCSVLTLEDIPGIRCPAADWEVGP